MQFYDWLETNDVPKSAISLWHALMHMNNKTRWKQTFEVSISTLMLKTKFRKSELCDARNILAQKGRIIWKSRAGNQSASYEMIPFCVRNTDTSADTNGYEDNTVSTTRTQNSTQTGTQVTTQNSTQSDTQPRNINKHNSTKRKETDYSGSDEPVPVAQQLVGDDDKKKQEERKNSSAAKKKEAELQATPHWSAIVDTWFKYYEHHYKEKPSFKGRDPVSLKTIVDNLQKRAADKEAEWTETRAVSWFISFLDKARQDKWLPENFLLYNLELQYDKIITTDASGAKTGGQTTGGAGAVRSRGASIADLEALIPGRSNNAAKQPEFTPVEIVK